MIDPLDSPYSIYKSSDGDELLDAHNDIIAVFDPHTEPEIERMVAAAPEMRYLLAIAATSIKELSQNLAVRHKNAAIKAAIETMDEIEVLLERIRGKEETE